MLESLLPEALLDDVLEEFPTPDAVQWWKFDSPNERKLASIDDSIMGPVTRHLLAEFNSSAFMEFLENLTGITGLVPDPHFYGGGLHQSVRGGYLNVHADFNSHPLTGLERRLNLLLYLNRDWKEEYGGALELWDSEMKKAEDAIYPLFNRCLIFTTSDISFHGHPHPLESPEGVTRRSLALYYYTKDPPRDSKGLAHNTLFKPLSEGTVSAKEQRTIAWKSAAQRVLPPIAYDAARAAKRRLAARRAR
jgi:hypothetical protein